MLHLLNSYTKGRGNAFWCGLGFLTAATLIPVEVYAQSGAVEGFIWNIIANFFGWLVWTGGMMLNYGINEYVTGFGATYASSGLGSTIDSLWVVVRDIFNLTFIFGLVFIGLRMIFNSGDSTTKKMLVSLVMAALLVNFSLFITKFVIDFSNIAATQLVGAFPDPDPADAGKADVSGAFMQTMGLTSVFNWGTDAGFQAKTLTTGGSWGIIFGTMLLFIVAAFVFLAGGILLMIRFVVLNIYMILSPLMFLGWIFPGAAGITSTYWKGFLGQAFFAPAYLLMLYFAVQVLQNFKATAGSTTGLGSIFATGAQFGNTFPPFVLSSVFLIVALVVAKKMGAVGANGAVSFGQSLSGKAKGYAGAMTFGAAARVGQSGVGGTARRLTESQKFKNWAATSKTGGATFRAANKLADSSFDARRVGGIGKTLGIGEGAKGGFDTRVKAKDKANQDFVKSLGETQVYATDAGGNFLTDATGNKIYATKDVEKKFTAVKDSKLSNNKMYQDAAAKTTEAEAKKTTADEALAAKRVEKVQHAAELARLEADATADPANAAKKDALTAKKNSVSQIDASIKNLEGNVTKANQSLVTANEKQKKIYDSVISSIEGSIKFQHQLAFIETRVAKTKFYSRASTQIAGALGGGGGAALVGGGALTGLSTFGLGVGAGALAVGALDNVSYANQQSVNSLRKLYGTDGTPMEQNKKRERDLADFSKLFDTSKPETDTTK